MQHHTLRAKLVALAGSSTGSVVLDAPRCHRTLGSGVWCPLSGSERFLTVSETRRLGAALAAQEPLTPLPAAVVRLLLLTGCRQGEIRTLQWQDYREGHLFLRDSKTEPRTVWLSSAARSVLSRLPRMDCWLFPDHQAKPETIAAVHP